MLRLIRRTDLGEMRVLCNVNTLVSWRIQSETGDTVITVITNGPVFIMKG
jgi:hypothetical protein